MYVKLAVVSFDGRLYCWITNLLTEIASRKFQIKSKRNVSVLLRNIRVRKLLSQCYAKQNVRNTSCCKSVLHRKTKEIANERLLNCEEMKIVSGPSAIFLLTQIYWKPYNIGGICLSVLVEGSARFKEKKQLSKLEAPHIEILNRWVTTELFSLSLFHDSQPWKKNEWAEAYSASSDTCQSVVCVEIHRHRGERDWIESGNLRPSEVK